MEGRSRKSRLQRPSIDSLWTTSKGCFIHASLPDVHEALRQNDPSKAPMSQPVLKKAPPTTGRARPAAFYSGDEPPRIGSAPVQPPPPPKPTSAWDVQPQGIFHPPTATPMTPGHPPRPPIDALPRPVPDGESSDPQASSTSTSSTGSAQQAGAS